MNILRPAKYGLGVTAAAALLAGCSAGSQMAPAAGAQNDAVKAAQLGSKFAPLTSVISPLAKVAVHRVTGTHPIEPDCCAHAKTLFVSDSGTNEVQMFALPSNTYIGQIGAPPEGFSEPQGLCSDSKGDVFVTNTNNRAVDEFSHNGTYIKTLSDSGQYPVGCAFDPSSGNLAVSNIITTTGGAGSISLYTNASGTPQNYSGGGFARIYFVGYMGKTGKLYLDGSNNASSTMYGSLIGGVISAIPITGGTVGFPGTVVYSATTKSMNIADQEGAVLYQISSTGMITGSTPLSGSSDIVQGTIKGQRFIGPDENNADVEIYAYPAGGNPKSTITEALSEPIGSAVSTDTGS